MESLSPEILRVLGRLAESGFELLPMPEVSTHYVVTRDGLVALVERHESGAFGSSGNPGKLTEKGFALFVRKDGRALFVAKGAEYAASEEEQQRAPKFAADLKAALEA